MERIAHLEGSISRRLNIRLMTSRRLIYQER